jgi:hypothetical protein
MDGTRADWGTLRLEASDECKALGHLPTPGVVPEKEQRTVSISELLRKHLTRLLSFVKNEGWGIKDDQIPP